MIFVDTSGWYAAEVEDDENHIVASSFLRKKIGANLYGAPITTDYVLDETLTLLRFRKGIAPAARFADKIRSASSLRVLWIGNEIFDLALKKFKQSEERQEWSFTDCTSFSVMEELGIKESFTFDEHFLSAGFQALPN